MSSEGQPTSGCTKGIETGAGVEEVKPRLALSEQEFGITNRELMELRERAPLVHAFELAVLGEQWRRSKIEPGLAHGSYAAECGVFQGHSMAACLAIADRSGLELTMVGLDSFDGLPPLSATDLELAPATAPYRTQIFFGNTSRDLADRNIGAKAGRCRYELVQGLFSQTLPKLAERTYFFVNIDCDLYEPHLECLEYFYPRVRQGGVIFFDDYHSLDYPMGRKAIDHFFADKPEQLWHVRFGADGANLTKTYIVKL